MPAKIRGEALLTLKDGRELTLTMNHAALFEAEQASGLPLPRLMAQGKLGYVGPVRAFLFGALQARHPEVTLEEASQITLRQFTTVSAAITAAMRAAFPEAKRSEGKKGANPRPGRDGTRSGGSGAKRASTPKGSGKRPRAASR